MALYKNTWSNGTPEVVDMGEGIERNRFFQGIGVVVVLWLVVVIGVCVVVGVCR